MEPLYFIIPIWLAGLAAIPTITTMAALLTVYFNRKKLLEAGAVELPGHKGVMVLNGDRFPLEQQATALTRFIEEFNERFPIQRSWLDWILYWAFGTKSIHRAKKNLLIEWQDGDWFWARDRDNIELPEGHQWRDKVRGQFIGGHRVVTAARNDTVPPKSLGETAFVHELNHWGLKITTGNADADHATDNEHGSTWTPEHNVMIDEINTEFK